MTFRRHLPAVAASEDHVYVIGGSDQNWNALAIVEKFDPELNSWERLPDLTVPRIRPAAVVLPASEGGFIFVFGGRNSRKIELKSVEFYDPVTNTWTLLENGMKRKRWSEAALLFGKENRIFVIGGRGKWVGKSVEVFDTSQGICVEMEEGVAGAGKAYTATKVALPTWAYEV